MSEYDRLLVDFTVGMVNIHCPACGELIPVDVQIESLSTVGGSYFTIEFKKQKPKHECVGSRS